MSDNLSELGTRVDGRRATELRSFVARLGIYPHADGSAYLQMGQTKVLVAVYGPHECRQRSKKDEERCIVNCQYSMAVFSTNERKNRPRGDRKSSEFEQHLQKTFTTVILTELYPRSQIDIFCEVIQADGSNLAACINAASLACASAGIAMKGMVSACANALVPTNVQHEEKEGKSSNQQCLTDVAYTEESAGSGCARVTLAILPHTSQIVLMELEHRVHMNNLADLVKHSQSACQHIRLYYKNVQNMQEVHERMADALTSYTQKCAANMQWN